MKMSGPDTFLLLVILRKDAIVSILMCCLLDVVPYVLKQQMVVLNGNR